MAQTQPNKISDVEAKTLAYNVSSLRLPSATGVERIEGLRRWPSFFIAAEKLSFAPGAKLIFTQDAITMRGNLFILAKEITSESQENPGSIAWEPPLVTVPPDNGSAPGTGGYPGDGNS